MTRTLLSILSVLILGLSIFFSPGIVQGQDYEAYQSAANAVENAASEIRMAEGAVGQALMEAMSGKYGEFHKWSLIDEKMSAMDKTISSSLATIGSNTGILLKNDPTYRLPRIELGHPFEGNLNLARNKKQELLDLAKQENAKLQKLNDMLAKVNKEILNLARDLGVDAVDILSPDEMELGGEAAVIVLSAWFGPPGMAVAAIAVAGTLAFKDMTGLYFSLQGTAGALKPLTDMKQVLLNSKKIVEENIKALKDGAREMFEIEQVLDKNQKKLEEMKAKIETALNNWDGQAQGAFQEKQAKFVEEAKKQASALKGPINLSTWIYGMSPIPPIQPGEYAGEADSMISQFESYSKAVEDGGDPDNFSDLASSWNKGMNDKYVPLKNDYQQKYEAYNKASEICWKQISAAGERCNTAMSALWAAYRGRHLDDAFYAASASIYAVYDAAYKAAYAALKPYGQALIAPYREMVRLNQVHYRVEGPFYVYRYRVESAVNFRTSEFWKELEQWRTRLGEATVKTGQALAKVPYYISGWKEGAKNIDANVTHALEWGNDVASIRAGLLSTAEQLKQIDKDVKEGVKAYDQAMLEVRRVMSAGQTEMQSLITRYGKLVNHPRASRYSMGWLGYPVEQFTPDTTETSERVKRLSKYVDEALSYNEPFYLEEVKKTDWLSLAAVYESKANELTFYVDWVDKYRRTLAAAAGRLNRISMKVTDKGFYATRGGIAGEILAKEWAQPPWASISQEAAMYVKPEDFKKLPWGAYQPWENMAPWQKLYAGQTILLNKMNEQMKYYVQARNSGYFQPVPEDVFKPIEEAWKGLRALCDRYDAAAKPIRDKIGNAPEEIGKEGLPVWEAWNKMPQLSKNLVAESHSRFRGASEWLGGYIGLKAEALKTSLVPPNNGVAEQLDNLILGYRPALEKYKRQQEEIARRVEEERRRWEAEEKKRAEEEKKRRESEQREAAAELSVVKNLYSKFRQAYESRNDSLVMSYISDQWESGDGTTLADLSKYLRNSFTVFNQIKYDITNLKITSNGENSFSASYDLKITGRIFDINVKHEEKSNVNEIVIIEKNGKAKINRTLTGRFWQVE